MNEYSFMTYLINEKKYSIFLIAIVGSITILSIPLILNQVLEGEHLLHVAIHEIGFFLATFLLIMAGISKNILEEPKINFFAEGS